jgi:exopolyphosphatase/guanosine-5'-triphosphate,3'-diphosphate pyrophosphatase
LLVDYLSKIEGFRQLQNVPARNRSVLHLGRSVNFDEKHALTVANLALELFDSAKQIGLHNMGEPERELLKHAATLHDVGDFLSFSNQQVHSYYIISNAGLLGFDKREIKIMANIARFHRKKLPSKKMLKTEKLGQADIEVVCVLSAFLRFAEKLDRSHNGSTKKAEFSWENKDTVLLTFYSERDCSLEEWSLIQNSKAFFETFNLALKIKCVSGASSN